MKCCLNWIEQVGIPTRWLIWSLFLAGWTTSLLTPQPVELVHAVLAEESAFYSAKALHVTAYAVLTILTGWLRAPDKSRWWLLAFLSLHGFGTEYFQNFVPLRGGSIRDVGLDHIGIALGLMLSFQWWFFSQTTSSRESLANTGSRPVSSVPPEVGG